MTFSAYTDDVIYAIMCQLSGIVLTLPGVEIHNALGEGERYHAYLCQVYKKVRADFPNIDEEYTLRIALKAVNDTSGPSGLVPTLLFWSITAHSYHST